MTREESRPSRKEAAEVEASRRPWTSSTCSSAGADGGNEKRSGLKVETKQFLFCCAFFDIINH